VTLCRKVLARSLPVPERDVMNTYRIAGIDVHKRMLAVVIADLTKDGIEFQRHKYGASPEHLKMLAERIVSDGVQAVVMESTAQYWKPVWRALEGKCQLHLAQAHSNRAPKGRKRDFEDAERLTRRFVAGELILSYVPDREQRLWRTLTRSKNQFIREKIDATNQMEAFLEEAGIKLSSLVSALNGASSRRILKALSENQTDPSKLAELGDPGLKASRAQFVDALSAAATLDAGYRKLLGLFLRRIEEAERRIQELHELIAQRLKAHNDAVVRLSEVPGLGADSAQQIIAEVGPEAKAFLSPAQLASWVGVCPGSNESAEKQRDTKSPSGNRPMRRILSLAANAAIKAKGSIFDHTYKRLVGRTGHNKAVWAVAHKLLRVIWKVLHDKVRYQEQGLRTNPAAARKRALRLIAQLKRLDYCVQILREPALST